MFLISKVISLKQIIEKETSIQNLFQEYIHLYKTNQEISAHTDMLVHEAKNPMVLLACFSMLGIFIKENDLNNELLSIVEQADIQTQELEDAIDSIYSHTQSISDQHYRIINTDTEEKKELLIKAISILKTENQSINSQTETSLDQIKEKLNCVINSLADICNYFDIDFDKNKIEITNIPQGTSPVIRKLINKINTGVLSISNILFEKGVSISKVNIHEMVELAIEIQTKLAKSLVNREITITHNIKPNTIMFSDRTELSQLLNNMIGNGLKYNRSITPQIDIVVKFYDDKSNNYAKFSIKDNGIGLKPEALQKVFAKNIRVEESANQFKGSGIGLPVCKDIVENLGGEIWVESDGPDKGSTFHFTIKAPLKRK